MLTDLSAIAVRDAAAPRPSFPEPVYVFMAPADQGQAFLDAHVVPAARGTARGIADPDQVLHIGAEVGDGWTMPVWTVIDGEQVTWRWVGTNAGDRPDLADIPRTARRST